MAAQRALPHPPGAAKRRQLQPTSTRVEVPSGSVSFRTVLSSSENDAEVRYEERAARSGCRTQAGEKFSVATTLAISEELGRIFVDLFSGTDIECRGPRWLK